MNPKIRSAQTQEIHYILVVGDRERGAWGVLSVGALPERLGEEVGRSKLWNENLDASALLYGSSGIPHLNIGKTNYLYPWTRSTRPVTTFGLRLSTESKNACSGLIGEGLILPDFT